MEEYGFSKRTPLSWDVLERMVHLSVEDYSRGPKASHRYRWPHTYGYSQLWRPDSVSTPCTLYSCRVLNVPWISCVRNAGEYRRLHAHRRPYFMSFGGSLNGVEVGIAMRTKAYALCGELGEPVCKRVTAEGSFENKEPLLSAWSIKNKSVFCLEPGGYAVVRPGMIDALALGCIPVLFLPRTGDRVVRSGAVRGWRYVAYQELAPAHWGPWLSDSSVVVDQARFLSGDLDLVAHLRSISVERIKLMQATIQRFVGTVTYHESEAFQGGDAIDITLSSLAFPQQFPTLLSNDPPVLTSMRDFDASAAPPLPWTGWEPWDSHLPSLPREISRRATRRSADLPAANRAANATAAARGSSGGGDGVGSTSTTIYDTIYDELQTSLSEIRYHGIHGSTLTTLPSSLAPTAAALTLASALIVLLAIRLRRSRRPPRLIDAGLAQANNLSERGVDIHR